jgi:predicted MFS family arabinose efflux permease
VSCLIWGRLSDIFGRRWFFIGGNCIAFVGSILGAFGPNITSVIWCMICIGLSFPAQLGFSVALAELIPNSYRGYMNGVLFLVATPFSVFGPVIARELQSRSSDGWRWAYYINLILTGVTITLTFICYHPPNFERLHTKVTKRKVFADLDYVGIVLFTAGVALTLTGLNWGGQVYPWQSGQTLGTLIGGLVLLVCFIVWEIFGAKDPLLPMRFMTNLPFVGLVLAAAAGSAVFYPLSLLWPMQITALYTTDPSMIGWLSCAVGGGTLLGQVVCGALVKALGRQKWQLVVTASAMTAFTAAMAATNQNTQTMALAFTILGSFMVGYVENLCVTIAPFVLDEKDIGLAVGILSSMRTWIAGIALAIYTTVLTNKLGELVPQSVVPAVEQAGLSPSSVPALLQGLSTGSLSNIDGLTPSILAVAQDAYQAAFSKSVSFPYLISIVFGGLAIIGAFFSPNAEERFNDGVARKMHGKAVEDLERNDAKAAEL